MKGRVLEHHKGSRVKFDGMCWASLPINQHVIWLQGSKTTLPTTRGFSSASTHFKKWVPQDPSMSPTQFVPSEETDCISKPRRGTAKFFRSSTGSVYAFQ